MRSPRRVLGGLIVACLPALTFPAGAAVPAPVRCPLVAVSTTWKASRTIVCAREGDTGPVLDISRDGGRTWTTRTPIVGKFDYLEQIALSPGYETDRTIYARYYQTGLFRSTDDGASFALIDPFGSTGTRPVFMTPLPGYALGAATGADDAVALGQQGPAVIANGVRHPVSGAGDQVDLQFLTVGGSRVVDVSEGVGPDLERRTTISLCTAALSCADHRVVLPAGYLRAAAAADQTEGGRIVAVTAYGELSDKRHGLWLSTDAGTTFTRNAAIQPVLDRMRGQYGFTVAVAVVRAGARRAVVLRLTSKSGNGADVLYRSYDGGASWRQVVPRGFSARQAYEPWMTATPGGHLVTVNASRHFLCSSDQGATWSPHCR